MNVHDLKIWPNFFTAVAAGRKTFEIRKADRPFAEGDTLNLREWNPETEEYTGHAIRVQIVYLTALDSLGAGFDRWVGMSIKPEAL